MIIVTGHLSVDPAARDAYLATCLDVVALARGTEGCVDFAISADLVDDARVNISERWRDRAALDAFRGAGPSSAQQEMVLTARVEEYAAEDAGPA